jgi:hypothetical protein
MFTSCQISLHETDNPENDGPHNTDTKNNTIEDYRDALSDSDTDEDSPDNRGQSR